MKKRVCVICLLLLTVLVVYNRFALSLNADAEGTITYSYGEIMFTDTLSREEVREAVRILDGKLMLPDNPSCGFTEKISFTIDGVTFALACDSCEVVKNCNTGKYIGFTSRGRDILEAMFEIRGGVFPCV